MASLTSRAGPPLFHVLRAMIDRRVEDHVAARARFRAYMRTHAELSGLSDRELADIGIARADISSVAYEDAYDPDLRRPGPAIAAIRP